MNMISEISPLLIPIMALLTPIVAIIAWAVVKVARLNLLHETIRHLSSSGQTIPPELLAEIVGRK